MSAPTSTITGDPKYSLFNRIARATTGNIQFDTTIRNIANYTGFVTENEEIVLQPGETLPETPTENLIGPYLAKLIAIEKELEQNILKLNIQGQSDIPAGPTDPRTINETTGIVTLGRPLIQGERFNNIVGIVYRQKIAQPPPTGNIQQPQLTTEELKNIRENFKPEEN